MPDPVTIIAGATQLIGAASQASELALRAIEAANNGEENAAQDYLNQARARYAEARDEWNAAAG